MASFVATGTLTASQSLANGETGFVATNGAVLVASGEAIVATGTANLTVLGAVSSGNTTAIRLSDFGAVNGPTINIGSAANVIGGGALGAGIGGYVLGTATYHNAGTIMGHTGVQVFSNNTVTIAIDNLGTIAGNRGLWLDLAFFSTASVVNSGRIAGDDTAVYAPQASTLNLANSGTITSSGAYAIYCDRHLVLDNTGTITGDIRTFSSSSVLNSGTVLGNIQVSSGSNVEVSGLVQGTVKFFAGANQFVLAGGQVTGGVIGGSQDDTYRIDRADLVITDTAGGYDIIISSADRQMTAGIEELQLVGLAGLRGVGTGSADVISAEAGDDTLVGLADADTLVGGEGNNILRGGGDEDELQAGEGDDLLAGNAGDDLLIGGLGADTLLGGTGRDVLSLAVTALTPTGCDVNLATGRAVLDGANLVKLSGIEDILGSLAADLLTGDGLDNALDGGAGNDTILGGGGADRLLGSNGTDVLTGGTGADAFVFYAVSNSTLAAGPDLITDFSKTADKIDLSVIDAIAGGANDPFNFIGAAAFSGGTPQVRYVRDDVAGTTTIEARLGGSVAADVVIILTGAMDLTAANFLL